MTIEEQIARYTGDLTRGEIIKRQKDMLERMDRLNTRLDKVQVEHDKVRKLLR